MRRSTVLLVLLGAALFVVPAVTASTITDDRTVIELRQDSRGEAQVERTYRRVTSDRISYFVPARYNPQDLQARDSTGALSCDVEELDTGKEILCEPRERTDYTVNISFSGDFVTPRGNTFLFSYRKRVLVPTDRTHVSVTLPEGYGIVGSRNTPYTPEDAAVGSRGRRISLQWSNDNVSIGDTTRYRVEYERLAVLERMSLQLVLGAFLLVVVVAGGTAYYVRRNGGQESETIASVFPVLKDDEKEVLRYVIDNDGEVEQRDIVTDLSYSKAKISKLLSDLDDRNLVEKTKQGRVNIVSLARDVGDRTVMKQ